MQISPRGVHRTPLVSWTLPLEGESSSYILTTITNHHKTRYCWLVVNRHFCKLQICYSYTVHLCQDCWWYITLDFPTNEENLASVRVFYELKFWVLRLHKLSTAHSVCCCNVWHTLITLMILLMLINGRGIDQTCRRLGRVLGGYIPLIQISKFQKKNQKILKICICHLFYLSLHLKRESLLTKRFSSLLYE